MFYLFLFFQRWSLFFFPFLNTIFLFRYPCSLEHFWLFLLSSLFLFFFSWPEAEIYIRGGILHWKKWMSASVLLIASESDRSSFPFILSHSLAQLLEHWQRGTFWWFLSVFDTWKECSGSGLGIKKNTSDLFQTVWMVDDG